MSQPSSPLRGAIERLSGYVDDLLIERRPRRFRTQTAEELELLKAAARLRGARPGAAEPDPAFMVELRDRIAADRVSGEWSSVPVPPVRSSLSRRRLLARLGGLVAALAAGFGLGRLEQVGAPAALPLTTAGTLVGSAGRWQRVTALAELPVGGALRFTAGPLEGHLVRTADGIYGLSAVCTHLGCLLRWRERERAFECPCHGAEFDASGRMKYGPANYRAPLPPLPSIETRIQDDQVYVWTA